MKLKLTDAQITLLRGYLERCEDAEALSTREYVLDLYENEPPLSLDLVFVKGGVAIDGAVELRYSEEMEGWYMGDRLYNADEVFLALQNAGVFEP